MSIKTKINRLRHKKGIEAEPTMASTRYDKDEESLKNHRLGGASIAAVAVAATIALPSIFSQKSEVANRYSSDEPPAPLTQAGAQTMEQDADQSLPAQAGELKLSEDEVLAYQKASADIVATGDQIMAGTDGTDQGETRLSQSPKAPGE